MTTLKFIRHKETGEVTRSLEQPLIGGMKHTHLDKEGNILPEYEYLTQEEINAIILPELKEAKVVQAKSLRDKNLLLPIPRTLSLYIGSSLEGVLFNISRSCKGEFSEILQTLGENETRGWTDATGVRRQLGRADFALLLKELNDIDNYEYEQYYLKKEAIDSINPSENKTLQEAVDEVRSFNILEVL